MGWKYSAQRKPYFQFHYTARVLLAVYEADLGLFPL